MSPARRVLAFVLVLASGMAWAETVRLTPDAVGETRTYHPVTIADLATTRWTHVEVRGRVVYVRKQQDGDSHITIVDSQGRKAVLEIIPAIPMEVPKKGQRIRGRGISRVDRHHAWGEVHPLESWQPDRE